MRKIVIALAGFLAIGLFAAEATEKQGYRYWSAGANVRSGQIAALVRFRLWHDPRFRYHLVSVQEGTTGQLAHSDPVLLGGPSQRCTAMARGCESGPRLQGRWKDGERATANGDDYAR